MLSSKVVSKTKSGLKDLRVRDGSKGRQRRRRWKKWLEVIRRRQWHRHCKRKDENSQTRKYVEEWMMKKRSKQRCFWQWRGQQWRGWRRQETLSEFRVWRCHRIQGIHKTKSKGLFKKQHWKRQLKQERFLAGISSKMCQGRRSLKAAAMMDWKKRWKPYCICRIFGLIWGVVSGISLGHGPKLTKRKIKPKIKSFKNRTIDHLKEDPQRTIFFQFFLGFDRLPNKDEQVLDFELTTSSRPTRRVEPRNGNLGVLVRVGGALSVGWHRGQASLMKDAQSFWGEERVDHMMNGILRYIRVLREYWQFESETYNPLLELMKTLGIQVGVPNLLMNIFRGEFFIVCAVGDAYGKTGEDCQCSSHWVLKDLLHELSVMCDGRLHLSQFKTRRGRHPQFMEIWSDCAGIWIGLHYLNSSILRYQYFYKSAVNTQNQSLVNSHEVQARQTQMALGQYEVIQKAIFSKKEIGNLDSPQSKAFLRVVGAINVFFCYGMFTTVVTWSMGRKVHNHFLLSLLCVLRGIYKSGMMEAGLDWPDSKLGSMRKLLNGRMGAYEF